MTIPAHVQRALGVHLEGAQEVAGVAPYWRLELQHQWGPHYVSLGTFGLAAAVLPGRAQVAGHDRLTNIGVDASYDWECLRQSQQPRAHYPARFRALWQGQLHRQALAQFLGSCIPSVRERSIKLLAFWTGLHRPCQPMEP